MADALTTETTASDLLEVVGLSKSFGGVQAISELGFEVRRGQIGALIGPNGAGKTTVFNLISGLFPSDDGKIWFQGRLLRGLAPHQIAVLGLARTFQNLQIFDNMSVIENVTLGRHRRGKTGMLGAALRLPSARREEREVFERAHYFLDFVGLGGHARKAAASLPFGQQRTLEIARALATQPDLLLLDEPAAGLNPAETERLADLVRRVRDRGTTVLLVEHDMVLVMDVADQVIVLEYGRKIACGTPYEVQNDERVVAAYLGADVHEWERSGLSGEASQC